MYVSTYIYIYMGILSKQVRIRQRTTRIVVQLPLDMHIFIKKMNTTSRTLQSINTWSQDTDV